MQVKLLTLLLPFVGLGKHQPVMIIFMHNVSCERKMKPVGSNNMDIASWRLMKQHILLTVDVAFDETSLHWSKVNERAVAALAEAIGNAVKHVTGKVDNTIEPMSDS